MKIWMPAAVCTALLITLTACGGGGNAPTEDTPPPPANNAKAAQPDSNKPDTPAKPGEPKPDPDRHLKIKGTNPEGWYALTKDGYTELMTKKFFKAPPAGIESVRFQGISNPKQPSPTAATERWDAWTAEPLAAALVFCVDKQKIDLNEAIKRAAAGLVDHFGEYEARVEDGVAIAESPNGRYVLAAFALEHGTYVAAGVAASGNDQESRRQDVVAWAKSFKPE